MKILVVNTYIGVRSGGLRSGTINLCSALINSGHDVTLYSTDVDAKYEFSGNLRNKFVFFGVSTIIFKTDFCLFGNVFSRDMICDLKRNISNFDLVLIQSTYQLNSTLASFYCRLKKVPYILRPHGSLDPVLMSRRRTVIKKLYVTFFEKKSFCNALAIQYSSIEEMEMTRAVIPNAARSIIIPEGIDCQKYFSDKKYFGKDFYPLLSNQKVLIYLGRLHPKKGIELAIQAFASLLSCHINAKFVIIGVGDKSYTRKLLELVSSLKINNDVIFVGQVSEQEKLRFLHSADIYVLPSYGENFGISVVEALASGLPVIVSDKVAISSKLSSLQSAIVVECKHEQFVAAMKLLLLNPALCERLHTIGPSVAQEFFSIETMSRVIDKTLKTLSIGNNNL